MTTLKELDAGLWCIDLHFQQRPGVIAAYLLREEDDLALIEVGPASTIDALLAGIRDAGFDPERVTSLLVTHIHLDHAGAAGTFMRRYPRARLYVHESGAPHMVDPTRLLASATRIYGDRMGPLWGDFEPVPAERIEILTDNNTVSVGSRTIEALYTPGHASHHVAFHDAQRAAVFTGDVAAVRLQGFDVVRPPTPPPDIDLEAWSGSLDRLRALRPRTVYLGHFGGFTDVEAHLRRARDRLFAWAAVVDRALRSGQDAPEITDALRQFGDQELLRETNDARVLERYELATPYGMSVDGLRRYFRVRRRDA